MTWLTLWDICITNYHGYVPVLLVEETGVPPGKPSTASHWQTFSHNVVSPWAGFELTTLVVIGTSCITTMTAREKTMMLSVIIIIHTEYTLMSLKPSQEEFEDTKGIIRIRISKRNRQRNGQKKKYKRTNNDLQSIHIKLKLRFPPPIKLTTMI
jgi:hypothetical protein